MAKYLVVVLQKEVTDEAQAQAILNGFTPPGGSVLVAAKYREVNELTKA